MTNRAIQKAIDKIEPLKFEIFSIQRELFRDLGKALRKHLKAFQEDVKSDDLFIHLFYKKGKENCWNFVINISGQNIDNQSLETTYANSKKLEKLLKECSKITTELEKVHILQKNISVKITTEITGFSVGNF